VKKIKKEIKIILIFKILIKKEEGVNFFSSRILYKTENK
jgi:hypothetical protein